MNSLASKETEEWDISNPSTATVFGIKTRRNQ